MVQADSFEIILLLKPTATTLAQAEFSYRSLDWVSKKSLDVTANDKPRNRPEDIDAVKLSNITSVCLEKKGICAHHSLSKKFIRCDHLLVYSNQPQRPVRHAP